MSKRTHHSTSTNLIAVGGLCRSAIALVGSPAEAQFGGMALCTNEGIRFIVNTKEPYTGAIYAADKFNTCSKVVENSKQM